MTMHGIYVIPIIGLPFMDMHEIIKDYHLWDILKKYGLYEIHTHTHTNTLKT